MAEFSLIIVAAGSGTRFGDDIPKQYHHLGNQSVLQRTLSAFRDIDSLKQVCIVINPSHRDLLTRCVEDLTDITICHGGATRQESVYNGLQALDLKSNELVLIHDAARPFVRKSDVLNLVSAMERYEGATLAAPVSDTLCYADEHDHATDYVSRDHLWAIQTPQAFRYGTLKQAHEETDSDISYTDDTSLVSALGKPVKYVAASRKNFKITRKEDMELAQNFIKTVTRVGNGFDVHAFDEEQDAQAVRLCGIDVPHDKKLKGHSDADVGLHALTDAILGAIGEGDIGLHFPPSDNTFKNMDSAVFLEKADEMMKDKGGRLINADITIICERPKVGKYREAMENRIAEIIGVPANKINVKATTTEKLGFTGRKEGIAAQAAVSIEMPEE